MQRTVYYTSNYLDFIFDKVDFPIQYKNDKDCYIPTAVRKREYWSENIRFLLVAPRA